MKYGDVVLLVIGDKEVPAFVLQSLVHPPADREGNFLKDAEGNFSEAVEHLTVAYPDPGKGVEVMSGQQVQGAIKFLFSVTPWKTGQHIGFHSLSSPVGISDLAKPAQVDEGGALDQNASKTPLPSASDLDKVEAERALTEAPPDDTRRVGDPIEEQAAEESHKFIADHPNVPVVNVEPDVTTQLDQAGDPPALGLEPKEPTQQQ